MSKRIWEFVSADLKPAHHVNVAAANGNQMVGLIKRHFPEIDLDTCRTLYCALVRPHLEYVVKVKKTGALELKETRFLR